MTQLSVWSIILLNCYSSKDNQNIAAVEQGGFITCYHQRQYSPWGNTGGLRGVTWALSQVFKGLILGLRLMFGDLGRVQSIRDLLRIKCFQEAKVASCLGILVKSYVEAGKTRLIWKLQLVKQQQSLLIARVRDVGSFVRCGWFICVWTRICCSLVFDPSRSQNDSVWCSLRTRPRWQYQGNF